MQQIVDTSAQKRRHYDSGTVVLRDQPPDQNSPARRHLSHHLPQNIEFDEITDISLVICALEKVPPFHSTRMQNHNFNICLQHPREIDSISWIRQQTSVDDSSSWWCQIKSAAWKDFTDYKKWTTSKRKTSLGYFNIEKVQIKFRTTLKFTVPRTAIYLVV